MITKITIFAIFAVVFATLSGAAHAQDGVAYADSDAWNAVYDYGTPSYGSYASGGSSYSGYSGSYGSAYYGGSNGAFYASYYSPGYSYPYYSYYAHSRSYFPSGGYYPTSYYGCPYSCYGYNSYYISYPGYVAPITPQPAISNPAKAPTVATAVSGLHISTGSRVGSSAAAGFSASQPSTSSYSGNKAAWY